MACKYKMKMETKCLKKLKTKISKCRIRSHNRANRNIGCILVSFSSCMLERRSDGETALKGVGDVIVDVDLKLDFCHRERLLDVITLGSKIKFFL